MHKLNLIENTNDLIWEEIYPGIIVYRDMLKNPEKAYQTILKSEELQKGDYYLKKWDPWAKFGTYSQPKFGEELDNSIKEEQFYDEKDLVEEVTKSYDLAVSHYFKHTKIEIPKGARYIGQSYCKYFNKVDVLKNNMTMQYHTDYIISQKDMPGPKFHTTCTFYINDNYNGGDIEFYINGDVVNHKPKAGDLVVFPSGEPYYHGVKTIPDGNKFFIRNFVMFDYDGSEEWLANQKKYGAYVWAKKEFERIEEDDKRNMIYFKNNSLSNYDEVYSNE